MRRNGLQSLRTASRLAELHAADTALATAQGRLKALVGREVYANVDDADYVYGWDRVEQWETLLRVASEAARGIDPVDLALDALDKHEITVAEAKARINGIMLIHQAGWIVET